ncbi:MAG TPA: hypothetical protein VD814_06580 [Nocardioides sp.]|nr:hypothetical protein [Nocardioides sp.]
MLLLVGLAVVVLALLALAAALATRLPALEPAVRSAVTPAVVLVAVVVVADLARVLRASAADRPDSMLTHVGYAVAAVGLFPMLVWRRPPEDDPEATVEPASLWVVAIAALAVAVCVLRLAQTR